MRSSNSSCRLQIGRIVWSFLGLLIFAFAERLCAQSEPDFLALQRAVAKLMGTPIASTESKSVKELQERVDAFQTFLQEAHTGSAADAAAVQHLTNLVGAAGKGESLAESKALVDDIKRDLDLKIQYYRGRLGVAGSARGLVKVTVKTLREGKPVMGLVVYCNPYRWADELRPMQTFPSLSSPTATSMMAGYYRCFASQGQPEKRVASRDIAVGLDGNDAVSLDIPLPQ